MMLIRVFKESFGWKCHSREFLIQFYLLGLFQDFTPTVKIDGWHGCFKIIHSVMFRSGKCIQKILVMVTSNLSKEDCDMRKGWFSINFLLFYLINFIRHIICSVFWFLFIISEAVYPIVAINNVLVFLYTFINSNFPSVSYFSLLFLLFKMFQFHSFISVTTNLTLFTQRSAPFYQVYEKYNNSKIRNINIYGWKFDS